MNPFDWTGPEFLGFYVGLLTFGIVTAFVGEPFFLWLLMRRIK